MNINLKNELQTRDGRKVEILKTNIKSKSPYIIVGLITHIDGNQLLYEWDRNGESIDFSRDSDLVNVHESVGWINIYMFDCNYTVSEIFNSYDQAIRFKDFEKKYTGYITTIEIKIRSHLL